MSCPTASNARASPQAATTRHQHACSSAVQRSPAQQCLGRLVDEPRGSQGFHLTLQGSVPFSTEVPPNAMLRPQHSGPRPGHLPMPVANSVSAPLGRTNRFDQEATGEVRARQAAGVRCPPPFGRVLT